MGNILGLIILAVCLASLLSSPLPSPSPHPLPSPQIAVVASPLLPAAVLFAAVGPPAAAVLGATGVGLSIAGDTNILDNLQNLNNNNDGGTSRRRRRKR